MLVTQCLQNKYYICLEHSQAPISWNPPVVESKVIESKPDCIYFGKVLEEVEKHIAGKGLVFYLTWNIYKLPSYGNHVIAIVLGDEWCRIPSYIHRVGAVFKCYGSKPILGGNFLLQPSYSNFLNLVQYLRVALIRLPGVIHHNMQVVKKFLYKSESLTNIYDIPLGYLQQSEIPIKNVTSRPYDVFFAGSLIAKKYSFWSPKRWLSSPKSLSRQQMLMQLELLSKQYNMKILTTSSFSESLNLGAEEYSYAMMNSKICLAPRGTSLETFRFFEGLRYGCVVITEALPPRWFYKGSPAIQLAHWKELDKVIRPIIDKQTLLQKKHQESLQWWSSKCSEQAIGRYIAERIECN